jgi:hypothetical protein
MAASQYSGVTRTSTTALAGVNNPVIGNWIPGSGVGTLGVNMYEATLNDPLVNVFFNADVEANVAHFINNSGSPKWARTGNNSTIEAAIMAGADQIYLSNEFNQYSTAVSGSVTAPSSYKHRTDYYWSTQAHVPAAAIPPGDVDGHWTIRQPNGWMLELFSPILLANGDIVAFFASFTDPRGVGDGASDGRRASMFPNYAGIIRDRELTAKRIPHALAVAVGPEVLGKSVVAPAVALDRSDSYTGSLPMGTWLTIPPSVDLSTLGFTTAVGRTIANAAQEFGCYLVDSTGPQNFLICHQQNATDIPDFDFGIADDIGLVVANVQITTHG